MIEKLTSLWPEIAILSGACICMLLGLSSNVSDRRVTVWVAVAEMQLNICWLSALTALNLFVQIQMHKR